jgi:hypothetical protein
VTVAYGGIHTGSQDLVASGHLSRINADTWEEAGRSTRSSGPGCPLSDVVLGDRAEIEDDGVLTSKRLPIDHTMDLN